MSTPPDGPQITTTTGKTYENRDAYRSAMAQWLTDAFYNHVRQLPDGQLTYLYRHFDVITSLPLVAAQDSTPQEPQP